MSDFTDFFPTAAGGGGGGVGVIAGGIATQVLLVGGGGAGSRSGGGAGGMLDFLPTLLSNNRYTITVGGASQDSVIQGSGLVSSINAIAGGAGEVAEQSGNPGGSGSGGGNRSAGGTYPGGTPTIGQGYYTQGHAGSKGGQSFNELFGAGGGAGLQSPNWTQGGDGLISDIITAANATTATVGEILNTDEVWFAGGGGGSSIVFVGTGVGGKGGGGGEASRAGTANTGGAGGGGDSGTGAGGSGVCIIRMATTSFTGTTFETKAGASITPGPSAAVHTLTQGDDTVIVFRSSETIMNLA